MTKKTPLKMRIDTELYVGTFEDYGPNLLFYNESMGVNNVVEKYKDGIILSVKKEINTFNKQLFNIYEDNKNDVPVMAYHIDKLLKSYWRDDTPYPYIMEDIEQILNKANDFIKKYRIIYNEIENIDSNFIEEKHFIGEASELQIPEPTITKSKNPFIFTATLKSLL